MTKTYIPLDIPKEVDMPMIVPTLIMVLFPCITIFRPIYTKPLISIIFFYHFLSLALLSFCGFRREIEIKSFTLFSFFLLFSQFLLSVFLQ